MGIFYLKEDCFGSIMAVFSKLRQSNRNLIQFYFAGFCRLEVCSYKILLPRNVVRFGEYCSGLILSIIFFICGWIYQNGYKRE